MMDNNIQQPQYPTTTVAAIIQADPLYFHRPEYAAKLVHSLQGGITHAFTLFAPRRMGKTQFLL